MANFFSHARIPCATLARNNDEASKLISPAVLSRLLSISIVLFWLTMTTLLVRTEFWPNYSMLRTVPLEHVAKLMWLHEQASDLTVSNEGLRVGHLTIHPKIRPEDGARVLEYSGNLSVRLPGSPRNRISWDGIAEFDAEWNLGSLLLGLGMREPSLMRAEILVKPSENHATYRLMNNGRAIESEEFTLDERGLKKVLTQVDLDPALYDTFRSSSTAAAPIITAQLSSITAHHERIDTYLVEVRQGGQTLLEAHISQLGQVLRMRTLVGYTLAPDDLIP